MHLYTNLLNLTKTLVYSFLQKSVLNDMYHLDGRVWGKLANGMATAVQIAHSVNGLAKVPWIAYISPTFCKSVVSSKSLPKLNLPSCM